MNGYRHMFESRFDRFDRFDEGVDQGIALRRVFGELLGPQPRVPPPIAVGEITSSQRRDVGALELITRFNERRTAGLPPAPGGLAWYTPSGQIRYAVADPAHGRLLWQGQIGTIPNIQSMPSHRRESAIRQLIQTVTGQRFRALRRNHPGADLIPRFDDADAADELEAALAWA